MAKKENQKARYPLVQCWHFVQHLRWHYQLFILSGGFLVGGLLSSGLALYPFLIQFLNVYLLLFGGATAYNSYWDKDEGAIGGLQNPPPMKRWMHSASLLLQFLGLVIAWSVGVAYAIIFLVSIVFFWAYSSPLIRLKGRPILSLITIGVSTGFNAVLLGYLSAGGSHIFSPAIILAALGVTFILLSVYPLSQVYQQAEDRRRGDQTFAVTYGKSTIHYLYKVFYGLGIATLAMVLVWQHFWLGMAFMIVGVMIGMIVNQIIQKIPGGENGYRQVMQVKYGLSLTFVAFLIVALFFKHAKIDGISVAVNWLL